MASILARNGPDQTIYGDGNAKVLIAQVLAEQPVALVEAGIELLRSMSRSSVKSMTETEFNSLLSAAAHRERPALIGEHLTFLEFQRAVASLSTTDRSAKAEAGPALPS